MAKQKINEVVERILSGFLEKQGLALWNTEFVKEGKDWYLRVFIEPEEGSEKEYIGTEECETVSRYLSDRLDEEDPISQEYFLEVCSPGLDRPLIKEEDYRRFAGKKVDVSLYSAFEGKKNYEEVTLLGLKENMQEEEYVPTAPPPKKGMKPKTGEPVILKIPFSNVSKVKLSVIF